MSKHIVPEEVGAIGEPKKSFGKILYYNRKARNLTIKQLEKKSGVSASFISVSYTHLTLPTKA